jgi:protein ImuB
VEDLQHRLTRAGLLVRIGLGDSRGAAWARAHHGAGAGSAADAITPIVALPVVALRLEDDTIIALQRLGLRTIGQLAEAPRAPLARRFGTALMMRLDQALGQQPEEISPEAVPPHYAVRLSLPEPIGLEADVMAGLERLLSRLCDRLTAQQAGARILRLTLRRVGKQARHVDLRLARPLRDSARILPLFARSIGEVDAGFGIDQLRLEALQVEPLPNQQLSHVSAGKSDSLDDLITRIGTRIGLENIRRFLPADSHIPERSFTLAPAAFSRPEGPWQAPRPRPLVLFPPEPITAPGPNPPTRFRWRGQGYATLRATGPERITPEWWIEDANWQRGLRDYWQVETRQGRRLWMFHTPQQPGWFVQGEFP